MLPEREGKSREKTEALLLEVKNNGGQLLGQVAAVRSKEGKTSVIALKGIFRLWAKFLRKTGKETEIGPPF